MRKEHNGKIYFPHYEETLLSDTLTAMVKSMKETGHLYYVEWNGKFYYSDEVLKSIDECLKEFTE